MRHDATLQDAVALLEPGMNVYVSGTSGESIGFFEALRRTPEKAAGVRFIGVLFPGINVSDYLGLHPAAMQRAYFAHPNLRGPMLAGRVELMPFDYAGVWQDLKSLRIDLAIAQVSPPDAAGRMSPGICYDFLPAVWAAAGQRIAHVNPRMPRTAGSFCINASDCSLICDEEAPLVTQLSGDPTPDLVRIGELVAGIVRPGATLQFGIGKMQSAVVRALRQHQNLRIHSGMVTEELVGLLDAGVIRGEGSVFAGVALGDEGFYRRIAQDPSFRFGSVDETHDIRRIAAIPNFVSINAAIEVDLLGQVNCDCLDGRLLAGVGGMPPFATGARLSEGGCAVFCLAATANRGATSRIVSRLSERSAVAAPRSALGFVITEHGVVDARHLSIHQRAERLIQLAAPEFRERLAAEWQAAAAGL